MRRFLKLFTGQISLIAALAASILFMPGSDCRAADVSSHSSIESKLALESSLEKKIQTVLCEALGTNDIIVIISTELQQEQKKQAPDFLPGIPEKEKVGEVSLSSSLTLIKKISATLILDKNLPAEDVELAKKLTTGLLGLSPNKGDFITVEKMDFRKAKPFTPAELLLPPNIWNLIWILLAAVLGVVTIFAFLRPVALSAKSLIAVLGAKTSESQDEVRRPEIFTAAEDTSRKKQENPWSDPARKPPFWFITPENAGNLAFILRTKTVDDLTIVLSYVPEAVAATLIETLYPNSIDALANLPKVTLIPEARIKGLEAELFSALDYVVGSEKKTIDIIEQLSENIQEKASLSFSAHNPEFAARLSGSIVRFGDIRELEPAQAQMLTRRIPMRNLALALKNSDLAQTYMEKLSEGMRERFRQELELTRNPAAVTQRAERMRIAQELKKMVLEGFITLKKTADAPPAIPAAQVPDPDPALQDSLNRPPPPPPLPAGKTNIFGEKR